MTRFKAGMLLLCAAMGASFAIFFFNNGGWAWGAAGIVFAIAGTVLPSGWAWLEPKILVQRLVFGLTAGGMGMSIIMGIHEIPKESHLPTITWFVIAAVALGAFLLIED